MKTDSKILAVIEKGAANTVIPEPMLSDQWVCSSAMQKAIRRGEAGPAVRAGLSLWQQSRPTFYKRLRLICMEDIGVGSVDAMVMVLTACTNPEWRREVGDLSVGLFLIEILCRATKSRLADELLPALQHFSEFRKVKTALSKVRDGRLPEIVLNIERPLHTRCAALWLMSGRKFPSAHMPLRQGDPGGVIDVLQELGGDLDLIHRCIDCLHHTTDPLALFTPLLASYISQTAEPLTEIKDVMPTAHEFEGVPHYALDQFTRIGQTAIRRFQKAVPGLQGYTAEAVGMGLFYQEGGRLNRSLMNDTLFAYREVGATGDLESVGVIPERQAELRACITDNMEILAEFRHGQLVQSFHGSQIEMKWLA